MSNAYKDWLRDEIEEHGVSKCCGAMMFVIGDAPYRYECSKCGKECDAVKGRKTK